MNFKSSTPPHLNGHEGCTSSKKLVAELSLVLLRGNHKTFAQRLAQAVGFDAATRRQVETRR